MRLGSLLMRYIRGLTPPRIILWCYFIWWLGVAVPYFDPNLRLWLSSVGIALIIGTALLLSTAYAGPTVIHLHPSAVLRLYLMPFFVSSFAALIKDCGFVVVFHPDWRGNLRPLAACCGWVVIIALMKRFSSSRPDLPPSLRSAVKRSGLRSGRRRARRE